jgi:hypothetical protein
VNEGVILRLGLSDAECYNYLFIKILIVSVFGSSQGGDGCIFAPAIWRGLAIGFADGGHPKGTESKQSFSI